MEEQGEQPAAPELKMLGSRLRSLRSAKGWTLEELADAAGFPSRFYRGWKAETGSRPLRLY